jgi:hypothetical protein
MKVSANGGAIRVILCLAKIHSVSVPGAKK